MVEGKEIAQKLLNAQYMPIISPFPSLSVVVDAVKMFELRVGEKAYWRHCLGLPMQELLSVA